MSKIAAFLVSPPYHLHDLKQLDSPETAKEGVESSLALLTAFLQSRGNVSTKAVLNLTVWR